MNNIILAVLIVGAIGLIFGCILAFASVIFAVKTDEREEQIVSVLPGANCGACGYAGCSAYAGAVVNDNAPVNGCPVGKGSVAEKIAKIMGVETQSVEEKVAKVMCQGTCNEAVIKYDYKGVNDCFAAQKLAGGPKECTYGCLGYGSCVTACQFDAVKIIDGIAKVSEDKCQACEACIKACPKGIIKMVPKQKKAHVLCINKDKGALVNKYCKVGCIGCKMCEKICPVSAISVVDNCAKVDYSLCSGCGLCAEKCPKKVIEIR